jgi:hypothetical protein
MFRINNSSATDLHHHPLNQISKSGLVDFEHESMIAQVKKNHIRF